MLKIGGWGKFQGVASVLVSLAVAAVALVAVAVGSVATAAPASAAPTDPTDYSVTLVARYCSDTSGSTTTWPNVRANRARNNIQETLKNLGPDTNYSNDMIPPVNPDNEEAAISGQLPCTPFVGMPLTFGSQIDGKSPLPAAPAPYLSRVGGNVAGVNATNTTTASVPRLDESGNPVGSETIAGAVTVQLNQGQLDQARKNALWTMGGTRADSLPAAGPFPNPADYNFAALRCNTDALNGDNVEFVGFRSGQKHAFCYAWYIGDPAAPPPVPGTITIKKDAQEATNQSFGFQGDVSFNPGGMFSMRDSVTYPGDVFSETRAPGDWHVRETTLPNGWTLTGINCVDGSGSSSVVDLGNKRVDITLAEGSNVTCTFSNDLAPPPTSNLRIAKVTYGSTGTFPFELSGPTGGGTTNLITTNDQGEDPASHLFTGITSGTYTMTETLPAPTAAGTWAVQSVVCVDENGANVPTTGTGTSRDIVVDVVGSGVPEITCTWANDFTPLASLKIRAKTIGGDNAAINYLTTVQNPTTKECDPSTGLYDQNADTTGGPGFHDATPVAPSDSMIDQPIQTYCIGGTRPTEGVDPSWVTKSIDCGPDNAIDPNAPFGTSTFFTFAMVQVKPGQTVTCDFTYVKRAALKLTKEVLSGNDLRSGDVKIELTCDNAPINGSASWPKVLTVPVNQTTGEIADIYVDGVNDDGTDTCHATELQNGAGGAQSQATITPFWRGSAWNSGTRSLQNQKTATLSGTKASNNKPVTITLDSGKCKLDGTKLTAEAGSGKCDLGYSAEGNPGVVATTTKWSLTNAADSGEGTDTGDFAVVPGENRTIAFTDAYTQDPTTITANRTVDLLKGKQTVDCKGNPVTDGKVINCGPKTEQGQKIKWKVSCRPLGQAKRGDLAYCKVKINKNGKVTVTAVGGRGALVKLTATAKGNANYRPWTRTWTWRVKPTKR
ncbi:MAG: prealbumin-like fold domain-containing protein [Candidatus Nanopelagicales bacterium]